jgi:hypothetical protein
MSTSPIRRSARAESEAVILRHLHISPWPPGYLGTRQRGARGDYEGLSRRDPARLASHQSRRSSACSDGANSLMLHHPPWYGDKAIGSKCLLAR